MPEQRRLDAAVVSIDGSPMAAELYGRLMLVHVDESVHLPDSFALHFDDPHFDLFDQDKFRLGTRIQIAFRAEDDVGFCRGSSASSFHCFIDRSTLARNGMPSLAK